MKSLKLKLFEYRKGLNIEQTDVVNIVSEHITLCDMYSEKEVFLNLSNMLDKFKFYESVTPFLESIDQELSSDPILYSLKDLYTKIKRKGDTFLYETALNSILECINQTNDEERKIKILDSLKMYEWVSEIRMFLYEMASTPQTKQNFISNGGKIDDVFSIVLQLKEGYLTYIAKNWVLLNDQGVNITLLENHITDDIQLKKMRILEQAINYATFTDDKIVFNIAEELNVTFNVNSKEIFLNGSESDRGTTLETLFNSPIVPIAGKGFYPILNETFNNLDKFMKIDTVKHVYNIMNHAFECYVFNYNGKITQYRIDKHAGNSYYAFENAMPLIENLMQELGADLTFFYEDLLDEEVKAKINLETAEKVVLEKLTDVDNAILKIKYEGQDIIKENKVLENLYNNLLGKKHKLAEELKIIKNKKSQLYK
jgi:hypothetical protein